MGDKSGYYYHYTDEKGAKGIQESERINPSTDVIKDAVAGEGVYLTSVEPNETSSTKILENNYDGMTPLPEDRVSHFVKIPKSQVPDAKKVELKDRNVYLNPGPLDLSEKKYKIGKTSEGK